MSDSLEFVLGRLTTEVRLTRESVDALSADVAILKNSEAERRGASKLGLLLAGAVGTVASLIVAWVTS